MNERSSETTRLCPWCEGTGRQPITGPQMHEIAYVMPTHLIEIAFSDLDERDNVLSAVEDLLSKMGQLGTISARSVTSAD